MPVKVLTRELKLPADYKYSWPAGAGYAAQTEATATAAAINVPVNAAVTVKVAGTGTNAYYIANPVAAADAEDSVKYLTENGTFEFSMPDGDTALDYSGLTTDKYHRVSVAVAGTSTNWPTGVTGISANIDDPEVGEAYKYVKEGKTLTVNFAMVGTATADSARAVQLTATATGATSTSFDTTADIIANASQVLAASSDTVSVTAGGTTADITVTYTIS